MKIRLPIIVALLFVFSLYSNAVNFVKDIQPIFQRSCIGCHHPGEPNAGLDLTTFEATLKGGTNGSLFNHDKIDESLLMINIVGEEPLMPMGGEPLAKEEIELIRKWIEEGAKKTAPDDVVMEKKDDGAMQHYASPPVITTMAYSPDGSLLAVSGYREVLVHKSDGSELVARLPGRADRIESLVFSPDGKILAAVGGSPAQFGEVQFWSAENFMKLRSAKISFDTLFGASFSPDGKMLAFGGADKIAYIVSVPFGKPLVEFENHDNWVFGTAFSTDGKRLVTGSRDTSMKLLETGTGSFVDDINSSNKGYGPIQSIHRHPTVDHVVNAGDDGTPRRYKIYRTQKRDVGNTDFNLIREYPRIVGGINVVRFSPDGKWIAAGANSGIVRIYNADTGEYRVLIKGDSVTVFSVEYHPSGSEMAVGGFDGMVRIYNPKTGSLIREFVPVPLEKELAKAE